MVKVKLLFEINKFISDSPLDDDTKRKVFNYLDELEDNLTANESVELSNLYKEDVLKDVLKDVIKYSY